MLNRYSSRIANLTSLRGIRSQSFVRPFLVQLYKSLRRAGFMEATRLLIGPSPLPLPATSTAANSQYQFLTPTTDSLQLWIDQAACPSTIGDASTLNRPERRVVVTMFEGRVVGFSWIATGWIDSDENFSRTKSLGTGIRLPVDSAFVFNAWVCPEHRGKALLKSMITYALTEHFTDIERIVVTMDWINAASLASFRKLSMSQLGIITRFKLGSFQWIFVPPSANDNAISCSVSPTTEKT